MKRILIAIAFAALVVPVSAHDKHKVPPSKPVEQTKPVANDQPRSNSSNRDLFVALGVASAIGIVIYAHENKRVEVKKADLSTAPVLVYTHRF